jgi:hypothetical protein
MLTLFTFQTAGMAGMRNPRPVPNVIRNESLAVEMEDAFRSGGSVILRMIAGITGTRSCLEAHSGTDLEQRL